MRLLALLQEGLNSLQAADGQSLQPGGLRGTKAAADPPWIVDSRQSAQGCSRNRYGEPEGHQQSSASRSHPALESAPGYLAGMWATQTEIAGGFKSVLAFHNTISPVVPCAGPIYICVHSLQ